MHLTDTHRHMHACRLSSRHNFFWIVFQANKSVCTRASEWGLEGGGEGKVEVDRTKIDFPKFSAHGDRCMCVFALVCVRSLVFVCM
jgi:hypothetical protein